MLINKIITWSLFCWTWGMLITFLLTPLIRRWAINRNLLDRAGQFHKTHSIAVPRFGGLALIISFIVIFILIQFAALKGYVILPTETWVIFLTCVGMFIMGFWDDFNPIGAKIKLLVQILIAIYAYLGGLKIGQWINPFTHTVYILGIWDAPLTILWIVGVTNLINLVDGVDGLAAGSSLLLMMLLAVVSGMSGSFFSLLIASGIVGSLLGFLFYNFPPAKIFMGDGGAYFLGILIAELALLNSRKGEIAAALIAPFFALGLPLIDASFTIIRRGLVGLPIFRADRKHIHHRLAAMGFSQRRVVFLLYAFCGFFALLALGVFINKGRLLPILFGLFMIVVVLSARAFGFVQSWYKLGRIFADSVIRRKHTKYALLLGQLLVLEAERCQSVDELWENFGSMLKKLNFNGATIQIGKNERHWENSRSFSSKHEIRSIYQKIGSNPPSEMVFYCMTDGSNEETQQLFSELATESWEKASALWQRTH